MVRPPLFHFSLFIGLTAFTITYCAIIHFQLPLPHYYPTLNRWSMVKDLTLPSISWYGQTAISLLAGCGFAGAAYFIGLSLRRSMRIDTPLHTVGWLAVVSAILMMLYIFQREWRSWISG